jgi:hypothetical protein
MKAKISATFVKNLEPQAKPFEVNDSEIAGFLLRVQPSGAMTYYVRYRDRQGKCKRYRLGQHGSLTTPAARDAAQVQLRRLATGTDIQEKKKSDRQQLQREKISSLVGFLDARYEDYCRVELKIGIQPVKVIPFAVCELP